MNLKCILDFDGVLFDTAFEAYSVCNRHAESGAALRRDVSFDEFLAFRAFVTDAWQYNRLYDPSKQLEDLTGLRSVTPDDDDWNFSREFFATRARIMVDPDWPRIMAPYPFFFLVRPLLVRYPKHFAILSTRNADSIKSTLRYFGADVVDVFGQESVRVHGSKIAIAERAGWLQLCSYFSVYVDDMKVHLEPFAGRIPLPLHASWGYDDCGAESMAAPQVFAIISALLERIEGRLGGGVDP